MFYLTGLVISYTAFGQDCVDNGNGTATHNGTGLMWQLETSGYMDWYSAMSYATSLSFGSHTDWRLPNFDKLN